MKFSENSGESALKNENNELKRKLNDKLLELKQN